MEILQILVVLLVFLTILYAIGLWLLKHGFQNLRFPRSTAQPTVSVIVSFHNEIENVDGLVGALLAQDYPREKLELILVNDRSTDGTGEKLNNLAGKHPHIRVLHIRDVHADFAPKKRAIDRAIRTAQGEIILHTDADGRPAPRWVQTMVSYFTPEVGMVLGYAPYSTQPPFDGPGFGLLALEYFSHAAIAAATTGLGYPVTCVGTNIAYRRNVFLELDGFGEFKKYLSGDDDLFLQRVREETHWKIRYATEKESQVLNDPPDTLKKFYHQRLRYGSKSLLYPRRVTISLSLFYLLNLLLLLLAPLTLFSGHYFHWVVGAFLLKMGSEFVFLSQASRVLNENRLLRYYPLAALLHIPYVVYFGLAGLLLDFQWGARSSHALQNNGWLPLLEKVKKSKQSYHPLGRLRDDDSSVL